MDDVHNDYWQEGELGERKDESDDSCYYRDGVCYLKPTQFLYQSQKSRINLTSLNWDELATNI